MCMTRHVVDTSHVGLHKQVSLALIKALYQAYVYVNTSIDVSHQA